MAKVLVLLAAVCFGTTGTAQALGPDAAEAELTEFLSASRASMWRDEQSRAFNEWLADRRDLRELIA